MGSGEGKCCVDTNIPGVVGSGEGRCCVDTNIREESVGSGEGKCCVDTNIREEWGVEKGSAMWTLTSGSSGEWRREVLCGH